MAVGQSIITADGINALVEASAKNKTVTPKYFRFSDDDLVLDPSLSAEDIDAWTTRDISTIKQISGDAAEFVCDVDPEEATHYTRVCGLYLDDGTLFAVAKPPFPFPPGLRQTFKIQISYQNITELMDFSYLPHQEEEQDLRLNNTAAVLGALFGALSDRVRLLSERVEAIWKAHRADKAQLDAALEKKADQTELDEARITMLGTTAVLGNMILDTAAKTRTVITI
jgi:hypothetical protein